MSTDESLVDQIVTCVMDRLRASTEPAPAPHASPKRDGNSHSARTLADGLVLGDAVVTGQLLEERIGGHRRIQITAASILTPSARDFLTRHNIAWTRDGASTAVTRPPESWQVVTVQASEITTRALSDVQRTTGMTWKHELVGTPDEAVQLSISSLCRRDATAAVVFARESARVVCLANRNPRVRAASAGDVRTVQSAQMEIGANLLCIDPGGKTFVALRNMLRAFSAGGAPAPPCGWENG